MFRMDMAKFEELLSMVGPLICKEDTLMRASICARDKLVNLKGKQRTMLGRAAWAPRHTSRLSRPRNEKALHCNGFSRKNLHCTGPTTDEPRGPARLPWCHK